MHARLQMRFQNGQLPGNTLSKLHNKLDTMPHTSDVLKLILTSEIQGFHWYKPQIPTVSIIKDLYQTNNYNVIWWTTVKKLTRIPLPKLKPPLNTILLLLWYKPQIPTITVVCHFI